MADDVTTDRGSSPDRQTAGGVTHIAGHEVQVDSRLRQRCAWCGALLLDYDLARVAVPQEDSRPGTWEVGVLVAVDGNASWVVEHEDGAPLPDSACAKLDPAVTT